MNLENKLGINDATELARAEEKIISRYFYILVDCEIESSKDIEQDFCFLKSRKHI